MSESIKERTNLSKDKSEEAKFKLQTAVNHKLTGLPVEYKIGQEAKQGLFDLNKQSISSLKTKIEDNSNVFGSKRTA